MDCSLYNFLFFSPSLLSILDWDPWYEGPSSRCPAVSVRRQHPPSFIFSPCPQACVSKLSQDAASSALCNIEKDWNTLQEENIFNIHLFKNHENLKPIKRRKDQLYINQQLWESNKLHILLLLFNNALMTIMMIVMIMLATAILCSDFHILSKTGNIFLALRKYNESMHMYKRLGATLDTQMKRKDIKPKNLNKTKKKNKKKKHFVQHKM